MDQISLCGKWHFSPLDGCGSTNSFTLDIPGSWKALPELSDCDAGCCSRSFSLDREQLSKRLTLRFGGVFRRAEVKLNGLSVGSHNGMQSPFCMDVTSAAREGENLLEVIVDSRRPEGEYFGSASIYEGIPLRFDGIYDKVTLEVSERQALHGLYTPIDLEKRRAFFIFDACSGQDRTVEAVLTLDVSRGGERVLHEQRRIGLQSGESEWTLDFPLDGFELWSPEHPALYDVEASLSAGGVTDVFRTRTGFKRFETRGTEFYLNGEPFYLLGYGDDFIFPDGLPSATDSGFYHHGISRAKSYGFNFARHHSHYPFEAYLDAADELGLLIQPELALANLPRELLDEKNAALCLNEWRALIRAYRCHPCIASWCGGNEMEWGFWFAKELYSDAKRLDPYRPVLSTDGNFMSCDVDDTFDYAGIVPGEYTDYLPYRELDGMFTRDHCGKPQVVHEMGNYTTLFNTDLLLRYQNAAVTARRIEETDRIVRERNCRELYRRAYRNSLELSKLCHKLNIEKARLSPEFCGYHLWTLVDYYETTQGLLDSFYNDKAYTAEEFARINSECVLLWDTATYVFRAGESFDAAIKLSKYGSDRALCGTLTLTLTDGERLLGSLSEQRTFAGHGLTDAVRASFELPASDTEREYTLTARFGYDGGELLNSWSLFAVPYVSIGSEKEIYIHYLARHLFEKERIPVRHFTIPQPIDEHQLIVAGYLYGGMLEAVENGTSLLLLAGSDTFRETVTHNSFKTPWWDPGEIWYVNHTNNRQISCVIEDGPAAAMLPYTGAWKLDLFGAVEQAPAVNIDALGLDVEPLIYGIDTGLDRLAYLFQFRLGKGKVLVCSLNHSRADMADIAVDYVMKKLINYAMSDSFAPEKSLTKSQLDAALRA